MNNSYLSLLIVNQGSSSEPSLEKVFTFLLFNIRMSDSLIDENNYKECGLNDLSFLRARAKVYCKVMPNTSSNLFQTRY